MPQFDLFDGVKTLNVVSVSGGKDSTATALLAIERNTENLMFLFADTGNESPKTYDYLNYLDSVLFERSGKHIERLKADFSNRINKAIEMAEELGEHSPLPPVGIPFLDLSMHYGFFPTSQKRFCTGELKRDVIRRFLNPYLNSGYVITDWQGIRAEESKLRAEMAARSLVLTTATGGELWKYLPIHSWKASDCFEYLKRQGVKANPLYEDGFSHVGCFPCVNWKISELAILADKYPERVQEISAWEHVVSASSGKPVTFYPNESFRERVNRAWSKVYGRIEKCKF